MTSISDLEAESCLDVCNTLLADSAIDHACALLLDLIEKRLDLPMAYNNLGWIYELTHQFELAIDAYHKALQPNPKLELAGRNLATLLNELGRYEQSNFAWAKLL